MSRLTKKTNFKNLENGTLYKVNADYSKCENIEEKKQICDKVISKIIDKLGQIEDLLEKYNLGSVETLDKDLEICHRLVYEYGQLEEELGIDLITLFKALKNGIWCKLENNTINYYQSYISNRSYGFVCIEQEYISYYEVFLGDMRKEINFNLKDYGKTWSLNKEDLQ